MSRLLSAYFSAPNGIDLLGVWIKKLWCKLAHRRAWHQQMYTDRARLYEVTECWQCGCQHSKYSVIPKDDPRQRL